MDECPFCSELDRILYESRLSRVLINIFPIQLGHILVVPKRHVARVTQLTEEEVADLALVAHKASKLIEGYISTQQLNWLVNQGEVAGQTIDHVHLHVIPRYENDNAVNFSRKQTERVEIRKITMDFLKSIFQH